MHSNSETSGDNYQWLEQVEGDRALAWVQEQNDPTLARFSTDPAFAPFEQEALAILEAADKLALGVRRGDQVYNFWQDAQHVRGIWRRCGREDYATGESAWQTIIDVDALGATESESWVWKGADVSPDGTRAIVALSRGGKDALVQREFDLVERRFVEGGFVVEEAKSSTAWVDEDTLLVGSDFGPRTLTDSGYPSQVRRWGRGTALEEAPVVHEIPLDYMLIRPMAIHRDEGTTLGVVVAPTFFTQEIWLFESGLEPRRLELPDDIDYRGIYFGHSLVVLRSDWGERSAGSLVSVSLETGEQATVYEPGDRAAVESVAAMVGAVVYTTLDNVTSRVSLARLTAVGWVSEPVTLPETGSVSIVSAGSRASEAFLTYTGYLTPPSLIALDTETGATQTLHQQPARFDTSGLAVTQHHATSADGTEVPYFVVGPDLQNAQAGPSRVLLDGYGGFEISLTPGYSALVGKLWLERGGTYVVANIRGGGEFGPAWHQAALEVNRPRAFEDFEAVAEDLIDRGRTTPAKLAISGGSNGGLLVGAAMTRRPELFGGVICAVPLLDMLRFHLLLAGASWMGEYGNPEDEAMAEVIASYSPYHNIKAAAGPDSTRYPEALIVTSTRDDRVHPGHARKMVARLKELGHPVWYFENTEGGHSAGADLKQHARLSALQYTYLGYALEDDE